jgi:hypothetical protein
MEIVEYGGWDSNIRLTNGEIEVIITKDVGPRVIRFGFVGGENVFAEIPDQMGGSGELEWMIRGGHRFWIAPEEDPKTYEPDNKPVEAEDVPGGVMVAQQKGNLSGIQKTLKVTLASKANAVRVIHTMVNMNDEPVVAAPWGLSVMAPGGLAIIPLPKKISHDARLTHNQEWSIWGYTDLQDPRWGFGSKYVFLKQDPNLGPTKIGFRHTEGWAAYLREGLVFIKHFEHVPSAKYPDGGSSLEVYAQEEFLEMESLGPLMNLGPKEGVKHEERWVLHKGVPDCASEDEVDTHIKSLI